MDEQALAERFEQHRALLRAVAARMLGATAEADDVVQDAWLRLRRVDVSQIEHLDAWLRTTVSRLCLDRLRARTARRESAPVDANNTAGDGTDPEREAELIESVGRAMLVVLDRLTPAERIAFVLHDSFAVPFDEIAPIVERSAVATKKLASRARQRVRGADSPPPTQLASQAHVVEAFLAAARHGDLDALVAVLDPEVVRRADRIVTPVGHPLESHGAHAVARETMVLGRRSRYATVALVDGVPGVVVAPEGRLLLVLAVSVVDGRVAAYDVIADPERLATVDIAVLEL